MLQLEHSSWLLTGFLLLPLLYLYIRALRKKKQALAAMGDPVLVNRLLNGYSYRRYGIKQVLFLAAFALLIVAVANPRIPTKGEKIQSGGVDVMILLDLSKSMLATDVAPSRLDLSRQWILNCLGQLQEHPVGLIFFAGQAYLQMPLTTDYSAAGIYLSAADPLTIPQPGTALDAALLMAERTLQGGDQKYQCVLLITDGEEQQPGAITTAKRFASKGIAIHTIGVGTARGGSFTDPATGQLKTDEQGQVVISKLNEPLLKEMAQLTAGTYHRLERLQQTESQMANTINNMAKRTIEDKTTSGWKVYFPHLLALALLFILIAFFLPEAPSHRL